MAGTTTYHVQGAVASVQEHLRVLDTTAITFTRSRATQAAASLAYYTFFSIFPLMLLLILGGSYFLDRQNVLQRVTQAVQSVLPMSQQFIVQNLQQVLTQRTAVGIFVLVSLLWSASGMFNSLAYEINKAWPEAKDRNFLQSRLIGVDMVFGLAVLLILSIALDSLTKWLAGPSTANGPFSSFSPLGLLSSIGSWVAIFLLYLTMYRWVPNIRVDWSSSVWGAIAAALGWKAASTGFAWYLGSPFAHYQLVYGSLGAIVAFLFLIYIIALVTLFGAHLTAAVDHLHQERVHSYADPAIAEAQRVPVTGSSSEQEQNSAEKNGDQTKATREQAPGQEAQQLGDTGTMPYPREDEPGDHSEGKPG